MCGIIGIRANLVDLDIAKDRVTAGMRALQHRGPDDYGVEIVSDALDFGEREELRSTGTDPGRPLKHWDASLFDSKYARPMSVVIFGHRRLSILDLSSAGRQPMRDPEHGNWITYNGEIYNFRELRAELGARGHRFISQCDTEVILKAYAEWGVGAWRRLRGIFAFGLWDARFSELHLVRDHLGVKPLYYTRRRGTITFASEVRAIIVAGGTESRLSLDGLISFLKYGSVQEPVTMVDGVESLPPGHYLTCEADGTVTVRHFWRPGEALVRNWETPPTAAGVLGQLQDSIGRQMVADVPVGVFLSAGVDSTTVAALAARAQPGAVRTFCIGSDEPEFDESAEAAATARILGCDHTSLVLEGRVVRDRLESALRSYDQPSYDGINTFFISMLVRQAGIKVALSGLGGDELFVGYFGFRKSLNIDRFGRSLHWLPPGLRGMIGRTIADGSPPGHAVWGAIAEVLSPDLAAPYFASRILFCRQHGEALLDRYHRRLLRRSPWQMRERELEQAAQGLNAIDRVSFFELQTYMLSTLLRDADQMSMAHGLELRVPLIDPVLVEHVLPIAAAEKTADGVSKRLLIDALAGIVPPDVFKRRKRGFTLPFQQWLLRDLHDSVAACFQSPNPRGPWEPARFRQVWTDFKKGRVTWSRVLTLFILEKWMEQNGISV